MDSVGTVIALFALGFVAGGIAYLLPALFGVSLVLALALAYGIAAQLLFNNYDYWVPLATPVILQMPLALFVGLMGQYFLERKQKEAVSQAIGYYLPDSVARTLTEKGVDAESLNQVIHSICLATDMSGFTSIAEGMSPKELASFMNSYFEAMSKPLKQQDVDITEFHADTIMCAWTSNEPDGGKRRQAVLAALEVVNAVGRFNEGHGAVNLYARIGLAEGPIYIGHTGGGGTFAYSILGDSANTAARIESLNKHVNTHILATRSVIEGLEEDLLYRSIGRFQFVGKSEPIEIVEVVSSLPVSTEKKAICEAFNQAKAAFDAEDWQRAALRFQALLNRVPDDGPSKYLLSICRKYQSQPPTQSEPAVIRMLSK